MAQASGAKNVDKASFTDLDGGGGPFVVQFNPKELKLDEKASWKPSDEYGQTRPLLTYEKGEPTSLSMDLIFDTTDTGANVNSEFVQPLRDFMTARYYDPAIAADLESDTPNIRPCYCLFEWGGFSFDGVVEKVNATFLMFSSDGTPLRAKVTVGMKERERQVSGGSGGGVTLTAGAIVQGGQTVTQVTGQVTTYTVKEGDTATSVANATGANERDILHANNLPDPISLTPGELLVIPMTAALAQILSKQGQKESPRNWKDTEARDPFAESRARAGQAPGPSALEESNPVGLGYGEDTGDFANAYTSFGNYEERPRDSQDAIGQYGATGAGDGRGQHSQHGANPYQQGERGEALGYDSEVGDGAIGEYGATGAGDGRGQHSQHGANPVGQGERGEALGYDSEVGDGAIGEYGATGAGDGRGQHTQNGANPVGQGETKEALGYDSEVGDGAIGEYGATGAGDGRGQHTQNGANPVGQGETKEALGYDSEVGDRASGFAAGEGGGGRDGGGSGGNASGGGGGGGGGAVAEAGQGGNGGRAEAGGAGGAAGGAGAGAGRDGAAGGMGAAGSKAEAGGARDGGAGAGATAEQGGRDGGGGRGGRDGGGGGAGAGGGEAGRAGEIDVDTEQMREDNREAQAEGHGGGNAARKAQQAARRAAAETKRAEGGGAGEAAGGGGAEASKADAGGAGDMTAKDVAKAVTAKTGKKPTSKEEVRRAADAMGIGEAIRQGKENVDDNKGDS